MSQVFAINKTDLPLPSSLSSLNLFKNTASPKTSESNNCLERPIQEYQYPNPQYINSSGKLQQNQIFWKQGKKKLKMLSVKIL